MAIIKDPEGNETRTLRKMIHFEAHEVLEVGCGDGRLTRRYAGKVEHVTAIDPIGEDIQTARANLPIRFRKKVEFLESTIEDYSKTIHRPKFDLVVFGWSL